jgi:hypothetical protein
VKDRIVEGTLKGIPIPVEAIQKSWPARNPWLRCRCTFKFDRFDLARIFASR